MGPESGQKDGRVESAASLVDALLVYAEPLANSAHVLVVGDAEGPVAERLLTSGARSVYVLDPDPARAARAARSVPRGVTVKPFIDELDVRDGMFDLAIVPDLADLHDPHAAIARLRSAVARDGAVVALGRARVEDAPRVFRGALGQAGLAYDELYDLFASQFDDVMVTGVLPFTGVVFAELGVEDPAVSVEQRLVEQSPPSVFVVVASERRPELDPFAIVQIDAAEAPASDGRDLEVTLAAALLKSELLSAQVDELKERLVVTDVRSVELSAVAQRAQHERDAALTRTMEMETILAAAQQALATMERSLLEAERGNLERDDRIAQLSAELDTRNSATSAQNTIVLRAERAEAALAIAHDELAQRIGSASTLERAERAEQELSTIVEAHAVETAAYESQLRDRARFIAALEKELVRREQLVKELVASVEEVHGAAGNHVFEAAPAVDVRPLERKIDELAADIARREGELTARGWRIVELENKLRAAAPPSKLVTEAPPVAAKGPLQDELDALRQALAQEHAARVAAESGEELAQARAELAKQAALLEQIRAQRDSS